MMIKKFIKNKKIGNFFLKLGKIFPIFHLFIEFFLFFILKNNIFLIWHDNCYIE